MVQARSSRGELAQHALDPGFEIRGLTESQEGKKGRTKDCWQKQKQKEFKKKRKRKEERKEDESLW